VHELAGSRARQRPIHSQELPLGAAAATHPLDPLLPVAIPTTRHSGCKDGTSAEAPGQLACEPLAAQESANGRSKTNTRQGRVLQTQSCDGSVVLFRPHVDDVSEASAPIRDTCGRIHVDSGVRELHVKLGQGSELIIALDQ
jgi:hypothetical protein